ncbi:MAG: hypothetical protein ACR2F2_07080 [Pyrinomonadaceae bacterium]
MKKKQKKNADKASAVEETGKSEFELPVWSVITFDRCAASGLTYMEAAEKLEKLKSEKVSGLCVVTDEAAARLTAKKKK